MKSFTLTTLAALLPALSATPITSRQSSTSFSLIAIHSGNQYVHNQAVNANDGLFWIGRPTTSYCPAAEVPSCPTAGDNLTVLSGTTGTTGAISTSHEVPGLQLLYVQGQGNPLPGSLAFNAPHSTPPAGSISDSFQLTESDLNYEFASWYACPAMGAYYVTIAQDSDFCIAINLHVVPYTGPTPATWEYV